MSENQVEVEDPEATKSPVFAGSARWAVAFVLIMGPLLQAIEFLLESGQDDNAVRVALWSQFPARTGLSMASGLLAIPFLLGGIAAIVTLTRAHSHRLAWLGGIFMTLGMVGLAAAHGYELAAFGLVQAHHTAGALSILNAESLGLPGLVLFLMFIGGAVLGTLILAMAMWRSPRVPRLVVLFMLAFGVLDFAVGQGVVSHLVNLVGFSILAVAVINKYFRSSRRVIAPATPSGA